MSKDRTTTPEPKRPYHVGVAVGVTTGLYAISLLAATRLQIDADRGIMADRAPMQAAITLLDDHHDSLDSSLADARAQYTEGATGYDGLATRLAALDARLAKMATSVAAIEHRGASLSSVKLVMPTVSAPRSRPGTTVRNSGGGGGGGGGSTSRGGGSSGGGGGSSSGGGGGSTHVNPPPPAPPPPANNPPPSSGGTGASGKP